MLISTCCLFLKCNEKIKIDKVTLPQTDSV